MAIGAECLLGISKAWSHAVVGALGQSRGKEGAAEVGLLRVGRGEARPVCRGGQGGQGGRRTGGLGDSRDGAPGLSQVSTCLQLRSESRGPRVEPLVGLSALPCSFTRSLSNEYTKYLKKTASESRWYQGLEGRWRGPDALQPGPQRGRVPGSWCSLHHRSCPETPGQASGWGEAVPRGRAGCEAMGDQQPEDNLT